MCYEDRAKKNFADMTWVHIQKSFSYAKKEDVFSGRKNSTMSYVVQVSGTQIKFKFDALDQATVHRTYGFRKRSVR